MLDFNLCLETGDLEIPLFGREVTSLSVHEVLNQFEEAAAIRERKLSVGMLACLCRIFCWLLTECVFVSIKVCLSQ